MDIDRFIRQNEPSWRELEQLCMRVRTRKAVPGNDIERALGLYRKTSTDLSYARTLYGDVPLTRRLTTIVGEARATVYGAEDRTTSVIRDFFAREFPVAVWSGRGFIAIAAILLFTPAIYVAVWVSTSATALDTVGPEAELAAYVDDDFESYYSSEPAAEFSTAVLVNNIQVSFLAYALGIFATLGTVVVLVFNGVFVGEAAGIFHAAGEPGRFWGLILPHGMLELTAVCVAGGAGLQLGWALISPGDRSRTEAIAAEGRSSVAILLGLTLVFIVAGIIEGFVTPSALPTASRILIGALAEVAFLGYVTHFGLRADRTI